MIHELKVWPEPFQALVDGRKSFEFRRNDRASGYNPGDILELSEWLPGNGQQAGEYTGRTTKRRITYITMAPDFGVPAGFVVMSLGVLPAKATALVPSRSSRDLVLKCKSCGAAVLDKGEHPLWKGIPVAPNSAQMDWYCREKEPCKEAFEEGMKGAEQAWSGANG